MDINTSGAQVPDSAPSLPANLIEQPSVASVPELPQSGSEALTPAENVQVGPIPPSIPEGDVIVSNENHGESPGPIVTSPTIELPSPVSVEPASATPIQPTNTDNIKQATQNPPTDLIDPIKTLEDLKKAITATRIDNLDALGSAIERDVLLGEGGIKN